MVSQLAQIRRIVAPAATTDAELGCNLVTDVAKERAGPSALSPRAFPRDADAPAANRTGDLDSLLAVVAQSGMSTVFRRSLLAFVSAVSASGALVGAEIDAPKNGADQGTNGFHPLVSGDRLPAPNPAAASREAEARIKQFKTLPGWQVKLFAAEPMLANPVAFSVDEKGRAWTSETYRYRSSVLDIRHYMFMLEDDLDNRTIEDRLAQIRRQFGPAGEKELSKESEIVRLIEDTNGDGLADRSTIVVDGLNSPMDGIASGILARRGQIWFTDIPSLWRFGMVDSKNPIRREAPAPADPALASRPQVHLNGYKASELLRGFGIRFSFTGHDLHGLKFGPDGRLYFSCGDRGAHVVNQEGKVVEALDEGAVFRCEPDGSKLEIFARGLRNPQELAFDEFGNLFTGDNDSDQGDRERWVYVVEGSDSGWRVGYQHAPLGNAGPWNMERLWVPRFEGQAAYIMPPLANIGDGPSGLVYNYGTGLPSSLDHRFFLAYFKGTSAKSGVYSLKTQPRGAGFDLVGHDEFVWNALVPDVDIGPDGAVWFADWHEGWPKSSKGRLYRACFPDSMATDSARQTAAILSEGVAKRSIDELAGLLAHPDMRVRQEAQFELASRGMQSWPALAKAAQDRGNIYARFHAMWAIGQIARSSPAQNRKALDEFVEGLLSDADLEVRAQAAKLLGEVDNEHSLAALAAHADDPSARVRYFSIASFAKAARGLREQDPRSVRHLFNDRLFANVRAAAASGDVWLKFASELVIAEAAAAHADKAVKKLASDSDASVRSAAVVALRRNSDSHLTQFLRDADPLVALESARAINDAPIVSAMPALASLGDPAEISGILKSFASARTSYPEPDLASLKSTGTPIRDVRADQPLPWTNAPVDSLSPMLLRVVNANFRVGDADGARRLAGLAARTDMSDLIRCEALRALATWAVPPPRDRIVGVYRPLPPRDAAVARRSLEPILAGLLGRATEAVRVAAADAAARLAMPAAAAPLAALANDLASPADARAAALRALAVLKAPGLEPLLKSMLGDPSEAVRLEASRLGAELNPNDAAGRLRAKVDSGALAEQQDALATLGSLKSDAADAILSDYLDKIMNRSLVDELKLDVVEAAKKRKANAIRERLAQYEEWRLPKDHLTPFREALVGGDAARGRKIFYENAAVACVRCHRIGNDGGGNAGPELTNVGAREQREYILESIVAPNKQIAQGFETAMITLKNGTLYAGIVKQETDSQIILNSPEEGEIKIQKDQVQERTKGLSGMPEGFPDLLNRFELRDLVEFLATRK